ncbi:MAG: SRPBCC domain-containing protein [Saprospiraceae bacterium]|nr:SRPBCC domain-containing protein [Saprospiraceae bacterium]
MKTEIKKDLANKKLHVIRRFKAPATMVWRAWTEPQLLEQWWAPKPYLAITKSMDFREGGLWLYYMLSPEGEKHWCRLDYLSIVLHDYYTGKDAFCAEDGTPNTIAPSMHWKNKFLSENEETKVVVEITFEKEEDIEKIIEMGFNEGFTMAHGNLDELLERLMTQSISQ